MSRIRFEGLAAPFNAPLGAALGLALAWLVASPAAADETHLLRYRAHAGEVLRWEVDQRSSVRNTMEGTTQEAQTKTVSTKAWKVIDVTPDGEIEFINLVEKVRMQNKLPDRAEMTFDSTEAGDPPAGFEDAARSVGVPLSRIRMTPRGEIVERDIKHRQLASDPDELVVMLLPEGPIEVGAAWNQEQSVRVNVKGGGARVIDARRKHRLKAVEGGVAEIETEFQPLTPTTPEIDGQLAPRRVKGVVRFDLEAGRIVSQRLEGDERVLGFAGPSSSMHLRTRLEERLLAAPAEVASRP